MAKRGRAMSLADLGIIAVFTGAKEQRGETDFEHNLDLAKRSVHKLRPWWEVAMLNVSWFVPPAIHQLADSKGLLEDPHFRITGAATPSSDHQYDGLLSGDYQAAVTAMDNVVLWNRRGQARDFRIIGQVEKTTTISLLARPSFPTIASLAGCRLLVDSPENGFVIALRMLLHNSGVSFDDCTVIPAGGVRERLASLVADDGDATLLGPPFSAMAEAQGMHCLAQADRAFPGFPGQGIVIRTAATKEHQEELSWWLRALERARVSAVENPSDSENQLSNAGVPAPLAAALVGAVPLSLTPDRAGVDLLIEHRAQLELPGADATYESIIDTATLADATHLLALEREYSVDR